MSDRKKGTAKILLIDDENAFHNQLRFAYESDYNFESARNFKLALHLLSKHDFDLILLDLDLGDGFENGLDRIPLIRENNPDIPIVVITNDHSRDSIVKAVNNGANDFIYKKEYEKEEWKKKFEKHLKTRRLEQQNAALKEENKQLNQKLQKLEAVPFLGESPKIQEIKKSLVFLAKESEKITILITGETGVGKEVAARYFHSHSLRKNRPFQEINLAPIQESLLESTLFGHTKGGFTGAIDNRQGYFQQANGGILFLDEIGEISIDLQIKLLRFLENKKIRAVGSEEDIILDVQIVAATNRNLEEEVKIGNFRSDFYQRLKVFPVEIPPLRERKEDIPLILEHYLALSSRNLKAAFSKTAYGKILDYDWPGNVRELINSINYMRIRKGINQCDKIDESCLPIEILDFKPETPNLEEVIIETLSFDETTALTELSQIEQALSKGFNRKGIAADLLNMSADNLRYRVLKHYGQFPYLLDRFPRIRKAYKLVINQS